MSGWTEYVIADPGDATKIADSHNPIKRWLGFEGFKFFGVPHHAALYQALGRDAASWQDFPELAFGDTGWVYELPPELLAAARTARDDQLAGLAGAWSSRLAAIGQRYAGSDLEPLLRQLRELAERAAEAGKPVLLWQSSSG